MPAIFLSFFGCGCNSEGLVSTPEQLANLVYCKSVFAETLRLTPPATALFFYNTVREF